jgi:hypothetical protein
MNSTCSYHMCPNNEWFYNLEKLEGGLVYMGMIKLVIFGG